MRLILLLVSMLAVFGTGVAQQATPPGGTGEAVDPETKAAALSLVKLMGTEQQMLQMIDLMKPAIAAPLLQKVPGPDGQKMVDEIIVPEMKQHIGGLLELVAESYTKHFTAAEIAEMRAFYETPIGQKMVRERGTMMGESQQMGAIWARSILPEVFRNHADELAAIVGRAQQRSAAPVAPPR
jgi:uncharacterized protein